MGDFGRRGVVQAARRTAARLAGGSADSADSAAPGAARRPTGTPAPGELVDTGVAVVFDPDYYLEAYPDVAGAGVDPLVHFLEHGMAERRRPSVLFDPKWYASHNPDVSGDPLRHYLEVGGREGRDGARVGVWSQWYLEQHPDVARAGLNPLVHFLSEGAAAGLDPSPHFDTTWYVEQYPELVGHGGNPLVHYLREGARDGKRPNPRGTSITGSSADEDEFADSVPALLARLQPDLRPLRIAPGPDVRRVNVVLESFRGDDLSEDAVAAVLLALELAERTDRILRVVTRGRAPDTAALADVLGVFGRRPVREPELAAATTSGESLEMGAHDLFLTTSWQATWSVLQVVPAERVCYVVQADERNRHPHGVDSWRAEEALAQEGLRVLVGSTALQRHLVDDGLLTPAAGSVTYESSVAEVAMSGRRLGADAMRHLYVLARPEEELMFRLAVSAVDEAIRSGGLPRAAWQIHLVGHDIPPVRFCDDSVPTIHAHLSRSAHRDLVQRMDVGLALCAGPEPGAATLQLAAAGAVVVTNSWRGKPDLQALSDRVLQVRGTSRELAGALRRSEELVSEAAAVPFATSASPLYRPWSDNLAPALEQLEKWFDGV